MVDNISNEELLSRALSGDRDASESLLTQYRERLAAFLGSRIGSQLKQKLDLDDVLQETFASALRSLPGFEYRGNDSVFRWLSTIGERVILKAAETERKKPLLSLKSEVEARRTSPSKTLRQNERFDRLNDAMNRLDDDHRRVIVLARVEGLAIKEIAERMGRSPAATSVLLSRALKKLKEFFGDTESLSLPHDRRLDSETPGGPDDEEVR